MKSRYVQLYNHDEDAAEYDRHVRRSGDPIREGYDAVLDWVARQAKIGPDMSVVELGAGTGNLTLRLPSCMSIECVDISGKMAEIAQDKLQNRPEITFVQADFLEYFDQEIPEFDVLVSTYSIHHLTEDEKRILFGRVAGRMRSGGRAVFGDLMVENADAVAALIKQYKANGDIATARDIEEEFFWNVESSLQDLRRAGFDAVSKRFSGLSWCIAAEKV